jgi:diguanylate cyclase (GGDEF)-like protein/PAS domain S-box-containing protein
MNSEVKSESKAFREPAIPLNEGERLMALCSTGLLDTDPEESFDRITRLVANLLDVPIALVSLVDEGRQWFKSRVGLEATQTPRAVSFCGHVVAERKPMVIGDATQDPRFAANPLVVGAPFVRAYMGNPIFSLDNQPIGTLCAIDTQARQFDSRQVDALNDLTQVVQELIRHREIASATRKALEIAGEREALYKDTFELAAVGIVHTALDGSLFRVNPAICGMLGYEAVELLGHSFVEFTHPEDVPKNIELFLQITAGNIDRYRMEKRFLHKRGHEVWVNLSVVLRRSGSGKPDFLIAIVEDISASKHHERELTLVRDRLRSEVESQAERLHQSGEAIRQTFAKILEAERSQRAAENRVRAIADSVPAMIGYWNRDLRCEFANEAYRHWFGRPPEELIGLPMREVVGERIFALNEPHARAALAGEPQHFERRLSRVDGTLTHTDARYLPDRNSSGEVAGFYVLVTDITGLRLAQLELEQLNSRLSAESTTDYLTGLSNRRAFAHKSEQAAERSLADGSPYGLILLDLDDFKRINDQFSHEIGDDVLRAVGRILKNELRGKDDVAARLGGEEFAVLCFGDLDRDSLSRFAERIRAQISKEALPSEAGPVRFTGSFGVALSHAGDADWKRIYARADAALYRAKGAGKNRVVYESEQRLEGTKTSDQGTGRRATLS